MFDFTMNDDQLKLRDEAREFTKWVPRELILALDAEEIQFPHEYLKECEEYKQTWSPKSDNLGEPPRSDESKKRKTAELLKEYFEKTPKDKVLEDWNDCRSDIIFGAKWKIATFDSISDAMSYMNNKMKKEEETTQIAREIIKKAIQMAMGRVQKSIL